MFIKQFIYQIELLILLEILKSNTHKTYKVLFRSNITKTKILIMNKLIFSVLIFLSNLLLSNINIKNAIDNDASIRNLGFWSI